MDDQAYKLLDAARTFLALLEQADEPTVDQVWQRLCNSAHGSDNATTCEPLFGILEAIRAEERRRVAGQPVYVCIPKQR